MEKKEIKVPDIFPSFKKILQLIDLGWSAITETTLNFEDDTETVQDKKTDINGLFNESILYKGGQVKLSKPQEEEWLEDIEPEEYPKNLSPLPCLSLRDRSEKGEGPLQKGDSRQGLIENLQQMLLELGYDLGRFGPAEDGVDGVFNDLIEGAVKSFQKMNKDYNGEQLIVDGMVGEKTADALNRMLVGLWYDKYQTPIELTPGRRLIATTQEYAIRAGIEV